MESVDEAAQEALRKARRKEEVELVERMADGDTQALGILYDRYSSMLLALAARILHDGGAAEDILQEVFWQAWRQAERYDPSRSSVSTWLVLLTRSRAIDRLRSRQVKERTIAAVREEAPPTHTSPAGVGDVLMQERRRRLREEMERLPKEQREVLQLAFFAGLTQREIAARTDTPLGTVKTRSLLGLKKLRKALRDQMEELL
jgi:RNA polymerase sigma factor (sigma-70 family)